MHCAGAGSGGIFWRVVFCQGIESDRSSGQSDASSVLSDLRSNDQLVLVHNNLGRHSRVRSPQSSKRTALVVDSSSFGGEVFLKEFYKRCLQCQLREYGRPIRLTRFLPLHAGKASTRNSDSGRQLLWRGLGPCDVRHRQILILRASRSDLLRTMVRWDHWASDFCRIASNSARSMIGGCSPGRISFLYLTSPI